MDVQSAQVNVNLAGIPALVLPCALVSGGPVGLPIGLQMIGAAFEVEMLLKVSHIFEQTLKRLQFYSSIDGRVIFILAKHPRE